MSRKTYNKRLLQKGLYLIMDVSAIPLSHGMDSDTWAKIIGEQGIVFYDSSSGQKPQFVRTGEQEELRIVDINQIEINFDDSRQ